MKIMFRSHWLTWLLGGHGQQVERRGSRKYSI
jgi:hypothetical protein